MSNEVAAQSGGIPAHLQTTENSGFVDDDSSLLSPPRIKLIQKTSKEFDDKLAEGGQFFNTVTNTASDEIVFTPIRGHIEYITFDDDGKMTFRSDDEKEAESTLGADYWKARRINILLLPFATTIPAVYSFSGTGFKIGTKLYQLCKVANPSCMFSKAYRLKRDQHEGPGGKYWTPTVTVAKNIDGYCDDQGWLTEDAFTIAREVAEQV